VDPCIFCMIAAGELEARIVYQDAHVVAFDDITPQGPVHTLVIPREHYATLEEAPSEVICQVFEAVPKVAAIKGVSESGYRVIVNNGRDAAQTVRHLHVHILGGARMSHGMVHFEHE
jgi:histidine triad (HIT) family protein